MSIWRSVDDVPAGYGPSAVTLGNFDGVHRGHRALLEALVARAQKDALRSVVVTFWPHPATVHHPELPTQRLSSLNERLALIESCGVEDILVIEYTLPFAQSSPEEFVRRYLVEPFRAQVVMIGADVRFGWRNTGDLTTMSELGERYGFEVDVLRDTGPRRPERRWSSTWIREALAAGDVTDAADVLGRWPSVTGLVVHGKQRGRKLGFPTANLGSELEGMPPADGVYAGWMVRPELPDDAVDRLLPAAISVGSNPTFGDEGRQVEAHVPGRDDLDLYGERIELRFVRRVRHMLRFSDPRDLVMQMTSDVKAAVAVLASVGPNGPDLDS